MKNKQFLFILSTILIFTHNKIFSFENLNSVKEYIQQTEEFPLPDNSTWKKPDYTSFYKKKLPTNFKQKINNLLSFLHLKKRQFTPQQFKKLLTNVIKTQENNNLTGDYVVKISPSIGTKFIVWGGLYGAFHSLFRCLEELKKQGIINNNFKIIKKNYYFIFNGNTIGWSPFNLETMTLILQLMKTNPNQVFFIKGENEYEKNWIKNSLYTELEICCKHISNESPPLYSLINKLFSTIPLAVYVQSKTNNDFFKFSSLNKSSSKLNEQHFKNFLHKNNNDRPKYFNLKNKYNSNNDIKIKAMFDGNYNLNENKYIGKLETFTSNKIIIWRYLSSPTAIFRNIYNFNNDAFAELTVMPQIKQWNLNFYKRDIRNNNPFTKEQYTIGLFNKIKKSKKIKRDKTYYEKLRTTVNKSISLLTKEMESIKTKKQTYNNGDIKNKIFFDVTKKTIVLGCSADFSKSIKYLSKNYLKGVNLRINEQNKKGGINGHQIKMITLNDKYSPYKTIQNVKKIKEKNNSDIFLGSVGSTTTTSLIPLIKKEDILVLFPYTGSSALRKPDIKYIAHYRPSYASESFFLIDYLINTKKQKRIAIFYQNDAYGYDGLIGARAALKKYGITSWCEVSYERSSLDISNAADKIVKFDPEAILFCSVEPQSEELVRKLGIIYLSKKTLCGLSVLEPFRSFLKYWGLNVTLSSCVPNPNNKTLKIIREYNKQCNKVGVFPNKTSLEGYISTSIFINIIEKIQGEITKEKIISEIEKYKNPFTFKGLNLHFNHLTREFSNSIWIDTEKVTYLHKTIPTNFLSKIQKEYDILKKELNL